MNPSSLPVPRKFLRRSAVPGGIVLILLGAGLVARQNVRHRTPDLHHGVADNGMAYVVLGDGPRHLLYIPEGPGYEPRGLAVTMDARQLAPYIGAGYTAWIVARRRGMPPGYSLASMADDYAEFICDHLAGRADLVIGTSYGGTILPYLAANHPDLVRRAVLCYSAATITQQGKELDRRWARAKAEGRYGAAGAITMESLLPADRWAPVRRALGLPFGWLTARTGVPAGDILVEADAEYAHDAREVLPRIQSPVLLLSGTADPFIPRSVVDETAALIPNCTVIRYPGGHFGSMNPRIPPDVLAWSDELDRSDDKLQ